MSTSQLGKGKPKRAECGDVWQVKASFFPSFVGLHGELPELLSHLPESSHAPWAGKANREPLPNEKDTSPPFVGASYDLQFSNMKLESFTSTGVARFGAPVSILVLMKINPSLVVHGA